MKYTLFLTIASLLFLGLGPKPQPSPDQKPNPKTHAPFGAKNARLEEPGPYCSSLEDRVAKEKEYYYEEKEKQEKTLLGQRIKGTKEEILLLENFLGQKPDASFFAIRDCQEVECYLLKLTGSESAKNFAYVIPKKFGYFLTVDRAPQWVGSEGDDPHKRVSWDLTKARAVYRAFQALPEQFLGLSSMKRVRLGTSGFQGLYASSHQEIMMTNDTGFYAGEDSIARIFVHEMAHAYHFQPGGELDVRKTFLVTSGWAKQMDWYLGLENNQWVQRYLGSDEQLVSAYSKNGVWEDFAETAMYFTMNPTQVIRSSPKRYDFMKEHVWQGKNYGEDWLPLQKAMAHRNISLLQSCLSKVHKVQKKEDLSFVDAKGNSMSAEIFPKFSGCLDQMIQTLSQELSKEAYFCEIGGIQGIKRRVEDQMIVALAWSLSYLRQEAPSCLTQRNCDISNLLERGINKAFPAADKEDRLALGSQLKTLLTRP